MSQSVVVPHTDLQAPVRQLGQGDVLVAEGVLPLGALRATAHRGLLFGTLATVREEVARGEYCHVVLPTVRIVRFYVVKISNSPFAEGIRVGRPLGRHQVLGLLDEDHQDAPDLSARVRRRVVPAHVGGGAGDEFEGDDDVAAVNGHRRGGEGGGEGHLVSTGRLGLERGRGSVS